MSFSEVHVLFLSIEEGRNEGLKGLLNDKTLSIKTFQWAKGK